MRRRLFSSKTKKRTKGYQPTCPHARSLVPSLACTLLPSDRTGYSYPVVHSSSSSYCTNTLKLALVLARVLFFLSILCIFCGWVSCNFAPFRLQAGFTRTEQTGRATSTAQRPSLKQGERGTYGSPHSSQEAPAFLKKSGGVHDELPQRRTTTRR